MHKNQSKCISLLATALGTAREPLRDKPPTLKAAIGMDQQLAELFINNQVLSPRHKLSFGKYPQAPCGVKIGGYLIGVPAGGTLSKDFKLAALSPTQLPD